jgi:hypothetical protein
MAARPTGFTLMRAEAQVHKPSKIPQHQSQPKGARAMSLGTILLIVLILILVGVIPAWPHARDWGYGPSGVVGLILVIVLVLFLMGRL